MHTDVVKYLEFKAVDGSYVFVKGKVSSHPAQARLTALLSHSYKLDSTLGQTCSPVAALVPVIFTAGSHLAATVCCTQTTHLTSCFMPAGGASAGHRLRGSQIPPHGPIREATSSQLFHVRLLTCEACTTSSGALGLPDPSDLGQLGAATSISNCISTSFCVRSACFSAGQLGALVRWQVQLSPALTRPMITPLMIPACVGVQAMPVCNV